MKFCNHGEASCHNGVLNVKRGLLRYYKPLFEAQVLNPRAWDTEGLNWDVWRKQKGGRDVFFCQTKCHI